jgi:predicted metal-binding membrane protein
MDMQCVYPVRSARARAARPIGDLFVLADHRRRLFTLIREFQRALLQPGGRHDAVVILKVICARAEVYFARVESLLDAATASGAAPRRQEHQRILGEMQAMLDQCAGGGAQPTAGAMTHALDAFVMHEAAMHPRPSPFLGLA